VCEACGSFDLRSQGFGTEKVEEDFRSFYPKANIARLDLETSRGKQSLDRLIVAMEEGDIDILIGTQMVTKGLDFGRLNSVVVLNADGLLFFPDFRANERAFQLLSQVIGRAGRRQTQGNALIQTYSPDHPILRDVLNNNYANMAKRELHERQLFSYPPYIRLIRIELRHKDKELCEQTAQFYAEYLRQHLPENIMGPTEASVFRVNDLYRYQILLKLPLSAQSLTHAKKTITHYYNELQKVKKYNSVRILFDVDPS
jgi:primosomal protein N' (replication factor Y)